MSMNVSSPVSMAFETRAASAFRLVDQFDLSDFYPAPFPDNLPTANLQKISLSKLLNEDEDEVRRIVYICETTGFFYLDMLDHAVGRQIWADACMTIKYGQERFEVVSAEDKFNFKPLNGIRTHDRGYRTLEADGKGKPDRGEWFNIPQSELFGTKRHGFGIPNWLYSPDGRYESIMEHGNTIANALLSVLEKGLELPRGLLTQRHRLHDDSGDCIRILKYPGRTQDQRDDYDRVPAHKDAISVAILFTWLGGLQIADPGAKFEHMNIRKEDWQWIRPEPGYAIINLGEAMEKLTNSVLKAGIHRVVTAPGDQRRFDRYSLLIATRPKNDSSMRVLESRRIPAAEPEAKDLTSLEWGYGLVLDIEKRIGGSAPAKIQDTSSKI